MTNKILAILVPLVVIAPQFALAAPSDAIAYWRFDESSGNAADAAANGYTLTNNGSASYSVGKINNAIDGGAANSSKYMSNNSALGMDMSSPFTYNLWVNITTVPSATYTLFRWENETSANNKGDVELQYYLNGANTEVGPRRADGNGADQCGFGTTNNLGTGVWHMLTMTWNGSTLSVYEDGNSTPITSCASTRTGTVANPSSNGTFMWVLADQTNSRYTSGLIDELGVWNRVLSAGEISQLYNNGNGSPFYPGVTGSGTVNKVAKFIGSSIVGNSLLSDDGSNVSIASGSLFVPAGSGIDAATNGTLNFGTATATTMTFGRSGQTLIVNSKIGVGTTTPTDALDVSGDFFANTIKLLADQLGLDTLSPGLLAIGSTTANAVSIGRASITTTIKGPLTVGTTTTAALNTDSNCNSTASPAVCGSAPAGSVAVPTGGSTLVVNTTSVTANSQIFVIEDSSLGTRLGITCNTTTGRVYSISARTAGTSFTIKSSANPATNKACLSYWIVN